MLLWFRLKTARTTWCVWKVTGLQTGRIADLLLWSGVWSEVGVTVAGSRRLYLPPWLLSLLPLHPACYEVSSFFSAVPLCPAVRPGAIGYALKMWVKLSLLSHRCWEWCLRDKEVIKTYVNLESELHHYLFIFKSLRILIQLILMYLRISSL